DNYKSLGGAHESSLGTYELESLGDYAFGCKRIGFTSQSTTEALGLLLGHFARDCRSSGNANVVNAQRYGKETPKRSGCFECGASGHFKRDHPKLRNKNGGNRNTQGWVYAVRNAEKNGNAPMNPDSNVVTVQIPYGNETLTFRGNESNNGRESRLTVISCSKAQEYMAKGCQIFLAQISAKKEEDKSEGKQLKDVPIV
nr:reverse transcriptase domain-containing protein [Tanacetum cinerariifolium]